MIKQFLANVVTNDSGNEYKEPLLVQMPEEYMDALRLLYLDYAGSDRISGFEDEKWYWLDNNERQATVHYVRDLNAAEWELYSKSFVVMKATATDFKRLFEEEQEIAEKICEDGEEISELPLTPKPDIPRRFFAAIETVENSNFYEEIILVEMPDKPEYMNALRLLFIEQDESKYDTEDGSSRIANLDNQFSYLIDEEMRRVTVQHVQDINNSEHWDMLIHHYLLPLPLYRLTAQEFQELAQKERQRLEALCEENGWNIAQMPLTKLPSVE